MTDKEIQCPKCGTIEYPNYFIHTAHPEENSTECPTCGHVDMPENFKTYLATVEDKLKKEINDLKVCLRIVNKQHNKADKEAADCSLELQKYQKFFKQFKQFLKEA